MKSSKRYNVSYSVESKRKENIELGPMVIVIVLGIFLTYSLVQTLIADHIITL